MHEVHVIGENVHKLKDFSKSLSSKGYRREDIIKILTDVGWKRHEVDPYVEYEYETINS